MTKKFSQGEWKTLDKAVFNPYQNVWSKALYVNNLTFCMYILGRTEAESESNAKLIAAAPDLLHRLNSIVLSVKAHPDYVNGKEGDEWHDIVELAEQTIKKATE